MFGVGHAFAQDEIILDDNLFDLDFAEPGETSENTDVTWYEPFTYKLSYQTISQVNSHDNEERELENSRINFLVKYQNAFAPGWLLQGNAHFKVYARQDYEYEANNNNTATEARLNELFIQRSFDQHSVKLGRQTIVWGEADGNSVLDVINTTEIRDLSIVNIEDARLGQQFLVWDWFGDKAIWSNFINLYPEFNPAIKPGSPLFQPLPFRQVDLDRDKVLYEVGSQYRWTTTGSDFAVMAAYLYENQLRYDFPPVLFTAGIPIENDYWLLGVSANRAIDKLLLVADVAYSKGVIADTFNPTNPFDLPSRHNNDRLATSMGLEYGLTALQQLSFSIRAETYLDQDFLEKGKAPANHQLVNDNVFGNYLFRYSYSSSSGDTSLSSTIQRDLEGDFFLASVGLNKIVNDNWSWFNQLVFVNAEGLGPTFLDDDLRLELTVNFAF